MDAAISALKTMKRAYALLTVLLDSQTSVARSSFGTRALAALVEILKFKEVLVCKGHRRECREAAASQCREYNNTYAFEHLGL
jgi:hypothetical protein